MSQHHGLGGILERAGLVQSDEPAPEPESKPDAPLPPPPPQSPAVYSAPAALTPDDQEKLKALEAEVYSTPSAYTVFKAISETLGSAAGPDMAVKLVTAAHPEITKAKIIDAIDAHLGVITQKHRDFSAQVAQTQTEAVDAPTRQVADLQAKINAANAQIADWARQITTLTDTVHEAQRKVAAGVQRFNDIEKQLSAPLLAARQKISALP